MPGAKGTSPWHDASGLARVVSWLVPVAVAVSRATFEPEWQADRAIVRGFGLAVGTGPGSVTTALVQVASLVPLGNRPFRGALVAVAALGLCSVLIYELARRTLADNVTTPRLGPFLACSAALLATLSPPFQLEATFAGGATVACAGVLATAVIARRIGDDARAPLLLGAALGATAMESVAAGGLAAIVCLAAIAARGLPAILVRGPGSRRRMPPASRRIAWALGLATVAAVAAVVAAPELVRRHAAHPTLDVRGAFSLGAVAAGLAPHGFSLGVWANDVGPVALGLACAGFAFGVLRGRLRPVIAPLLAIVVVDALSPHSAPPVFEADPLAAVRLADVGVLAIAVSLGVQSVVAMLVASTRSPVGDFRGSSFGRSAAALVVALDVTFVTVVAEQAADRVDRSSTHGAEAWTDEAFERLAPRATVLARAPQTVWRLWSAVAAEGARPDVLVVAMPLLGAGHVAADAMRGEPRIKGVITDVALGGSAGESALSALSSVRPLEVELDPSWDRRVLGYLVADHLWHAFAPEPLGPSDRRMAWGRFTPTVRAILAAATSAEHRDLATVSLLAVATREQAAVAAALGNRDDALALVSLLDTMVPGDAWGVDLRRRLDDPKGAPLDPRTLFR